MQLSSEGGDRFLRLIGLDEAYLESGRSYFTVESHSTIIAQIHAGDQVYVTVQLLSHDPKRLRMFTSMHRADDDSVDRDRGAHDAARRRAGRQGVTRAGSVQAKLAEIAAHHDKLPRPPQVGRGGRPTSRLTCQHLER